MGEMRNVYKILVGNMMGRELRRRRRWEDNIKMDFIEIGYGLDSTGLG
jgi:hypothetical protein